MAPMHSTVNGSFSLRRSIRFITTLLALLPLAVAAQDTTLYREETIPGAVEQTFKSSTPADLVIANRPIITLRTEVLGNTPELRVANIEKRLADALDAGGPGVLRDSVMFSGRAILIDGRPLMYIAPTDMDPTLGEDLEATTQLTMDRLKVAIGELREMRDTGSMIRNVGLVLAYSAVLALVLFLLGRLRRLIHRKAEAFIQRSMERSGIKGGLSRGHTLYIVAQRLAMMVIGVFMLVVLYFWLTAVLDRIPLTRAWSESMFHLLANAALWVFHGVLDALPGLAMVTIIFLLARTIIRMVSALFNRIQSGELEVTWLDAAIAAPTRRVVVLMLWIFTLVIAYPYIPGSSTKAFQGVSVLVGVMFSLGSSGVISQAMSGLALMFNRIIRVGECVAVGDVVTGVVKQIGYFNTVIVTSYGEEVTVPNGLVISSKVTNLSRHTGKGILWTTGITIGYDSPWRQIHAMLLEAARNTPAIATEPAPKVAQHALNDFYVDYRLTVVVQGPFRQTLSDLHANIQDIFNANGVQIMSPHYERDPESAKVVPPAQRDPGIRKNP